MNWFIPGRSRGSTGEAQQNPPRFPTPLLLLIVGIVIVATLTFTGFAWAKKTVTLVVDGKELQVQTFTRTVAGVLKEQNIKLGSEDEVAPALSANLSEGDRVLVSRAMKVTIKVDGKLLKAVSHGQTVSEVLKEEKIVLGKLDLVNPAVGSPLTSGMEIKVTRVSIKEEVKNVPVDFATEKLSEPQLARGITRVIQQGKKGTEKQVWEMTFHDGKEVSRRLVESKEIAPPVNRVIKVGTLQQVSRGGTDIRFREALEMVSTAYTYTGRKTATGVPPRVGGVAVDPRVIPFGTRLYIEGYGYATAIDRGGDIKGQRIDLFMETLSQCRNWGTRRVKVYVMD